MPKKSKRYVLTDNAPVYCLGMGKTLRHGVPFAESDLEKCDLEQLQKARHLVEYATDETGKRMNTAVMDDPSSVKSGSSEGLGSLADLDLDALNEMAVERGLKPADIFKDKAAAIDWLSKNSRS